MQRFSASHQADTHLLVSETHSVCIREKSFVFSATKFATVCDNRQKVNLLTTSNDMSIGNIRACLELSFGLTGLRSALF